MRVRGQQFKWWEVLCWLWALGWVIVAFWLVRDRHWWATVLQVIGSAVTAYGLSQAYARSKYNQSVIQRLRLQVQLIWDKVLGRRRVEANFGASGTLSATLQPVGAAIVGFLPLKVAERDSTQLQIAKLVVHLNRLTEQIPTIHSRIDVVKKDVTRVSDDLAAARQETLAHIESGVDELNKRLDATQVLDLRWAIIGLVVTTVGVLLSF